MAINSNGGCDLANIPGGVLGSANISAVVRYPFEPVTARPVVSNTVTKTVTSLFSKTITCYPKGTQPEEQRAAICVAQATDITGLRLLVRRCASWPTSMPRTSSLPGCDSGDWHGDNGNPPFQVAVDRDW